MAIQASAHSVCRNTAKGPGDPSALQASEREEAELLTERKRKEGALRQIQALVAALMANAPAEISVKDTDGRFVVINRELERLFGVTSEKAEGKTFRDFGPEHLAASFEASDRAVMESRQAIQEEFEELHDGEIHHYVTVKFPLLDRDDELVGVGAISTDISERRQVEAALARSESLFQQAAKTAKLGHFIWDDVEEKYETISLEYAQIKGFSSVGAYLEYCTSLEQLYSLIHPDDREQYVKVIAEVDFDAEYRIVQMDGGIRHVREAAQGTVDERGRIVRTVGILQDITEQKRAEEALRESEEQFRNLVEGSIQGVMIQRSWKPLFVNQTYADLLGYESPEEILAMASGESLIAPHERERVRSYKEARDRGDEAPTQYEYDAQRKDGSVITLENIARVVDWQDMPAVQNTVIDITERKEAEQALQKYEDIFAASRDYMAFVDADYIYRAVNPAYLESRQMTREEIIGHHMQEIVGKEIFETIAKPQMDECLAGHQLDYEMWLEYPTLGRRWVSIRYHPHRVFGDAIEGLVYHGRDITEQKLAEEELRQSEERLSDFARNASDWFWEMDKDLRFSFGFDPNGKFLPEQYIGKTRRELGCTDGEYKKWEAHLADLEAHKPFQDFEYNFVDPNNDAQRWTISGSPRFDEGGTFIGYRGTGREVTKAYRLSQQLTYQATHDALTGLVNRGEFERRLRRVLDTAHTQHTENALCYLDLDLFKIVNDTCGHTAGDELLRQLARLLKERVRARDTLARLGGDEFGVLMEHCTVESARRLAESLRKAVAELRFVWEDKTFRIEVSIGLVPITEASGDLTHVLGRADAACYAAKDKGGNRVHLYREDDEELARRHGEMAWVSRISWALEEERFLLYFQPIVPVGGCDEETLHYELLVRMRDEDGQIVPPGAFLPAAERYNLATQIDRWVVGTAFQWLSDHPRHREQLSLCAINLSGRSMGDEEFLAFLTEKFSDGKVAPEKICFEVTETAAIADLSAATQFMNSCRALGCRFALDDFGSGLSSFAYLKTLPVDYLKIDGLFVRDIVEDAADYAMVKCINEMGHVTGKLTIAEFVEDEAILKKLQAIGVNYAQGYGIARPRPIEEMIDLKSMGERLPDD